MPYRDERGRFTKRPSSRDDYCWYAAGVFVGVLIVVFLCLLARVARGI